MRIKKISLASASLLMVFGALAGCSKKEETTPVGPSSGSTSGEPAPVDTGRGVLTKLEIKAGFKMSYLPGEQIDWSKFSLVGLFKKENSSLYEQYEFTGNQIAYDISDTASLPATAEIVVFSDGIHAQSGLVERDTPYVIEAAPVESLTSKFALGKIFVGEVTPAKYIMTQFIEPRNISTYKANVNKDHSLEGSFYRTSEILTVGSTNTFKYEPTGMFLDLNDLDAAPQLLTNYRKTYSLKEIVSSTERNLVDFDTYAEAKQGGVKFKAAAEGKSFELSCKPTAYNAFAPLTIDLKVEKGLNIYTAKQLGALNLTHFTKEDFATYAHRYAYHYGDDSDIFSNDVRRVYWNEEASEWKHVDTTAVWKEWLVERSVFTAEEETAYQDQPGFFLQEDINVLKDDIPGIYFINGQEGQTVDTDSDGVYDCDGCLRDYVDIYKPIVDENDVVINGNYFSLDSDLGPTRSRGGDDTIYYHDTYEVPNADFQPGHSTLIKFCGKLPETSWNRYYEAGVDLVNGSIGVLKNVGSNGHVSMQYFDIPDQNPGETDEQYKERIEPILQRNAIMSITGLILVKNAFCGADYDNLNVKNYQIGLFPDNMVQGSRVHEVGIHGEGTVNFNTLIRDCRVYDCSNCGICNFQNGGVIVEHSDLKRYGGSSLVNMGDRLTENEHQAGTADTSDDIEYDVRRARTYYMSDVVTENFIDGTETYFKTVQANELFDNLNMYASFFGSIGNTFRQDGKYNLLGLDFDGSALGSKNKEFFSDFVFDYDKADGEGYLDSSCGGNAWFNVYCKLPQANKHALCKEVVLPSMPSQVPAAIWDSLTDEQKWDLAYANTPAAQTPLFVTEKGECFTSFYSDAAPSCKLHKVDVDLGADGKLGTADDVVTTLDDHMTTADQLEGTKMVLFLPAGQTTCIASFEVKKL